MSAGAVFTQRWIIEAGSPIPTVILGDPATCRRKVEAYRALGTDRLMCFVQIADLPQETILGCSRSVGKV